VLRALVVSLVLLLAPAAWALPADDVLPVFTPADGVSTAQMEEGEWVVRFAPTADAIYRTVRGRIVRTSCVRVGGHALGYERLAPRARSTLWSGVRGKVDLCTVSVVRRSDTRSCYDGVDDPAWCPRVVVAVTPKGAAYLADAALRVNVLYGFLGSRSYPGEVVALPAPDALPPQGQLGVWRSGQQLSVSVLRPDGRRYFMARLLVDGELVTSTNLPGLLDLPPVS
jgi:hypothetical protein